MDRRGQKLSNINGTDALTPLIVFVVTVVYVFAPLTLVVGLFGLSQSWGTPVARWGGGVSVIGWLVALGLVIAGLITDENSPPPYGDDD